MLDLRSPDRPLRIGHRGAAALAPENTLASLRAAVEHGADVVELDVLALPEDRKPGDRLVLAHSAREAAGAPDAFEDGLAELAPHEVIVHVDVKSDGIESAVVEALHRHGLVDRALVSSVSPAVLRRFAQVEPRLGRALTYPEDRLGISEWALGGPVVWGALRLSRVVLPHRIGTLLAQAQATIASLEHSLVTAAVVERCHALGVPVIAWTVDEAGRAADLAKLGVDGIVSDDPRLLAATLSG